MQGRAMDISKDWRTTGSKDSILGYMSRGDSVPEVSTTARYFLNTGRMARDASEGGEEGRELEQLAEEAAGGTAPDLSTPIAGWDHGCEAWRASAAPTPA